MLSALLPTFESKRDHQEHADVPGGRGEPPNRQAKSRLLCTLAAHRAPAESIRNKLSV
jgi:hypothetical protein